MVFGLEFIFTRIWGGGGRFFFKVVLKERQFLVRDSVTWEYEGRVS